MRDEIDPITLEVHWSRLIAIADEAATTLLRTAFSTIIRESNDYATVLLSIEGDTIAECSGGVPAFAGLLGRTAKAFLAKFPLETWREGDVVITNNPWLSNGHLPDISMMTPVFHKGELVAFTGSAAHSPDIGGSLRADNREIYEEGICIPPMHFYREGVRNEGMIELFLNNVRVSSLVLGDMEAQVTANEVCRRRAVEFLRDTGMNDFVQLGSAVQEKSEQAMRHAIERIPDGVYRSSLDSDGFDHQPTHIECAITIAGSDMTVDYAGTSAQIDRPTNCVLNYTQAYSIYPLKCVLDPLTRRNGGSYRPINVTAPVGSILNPVYPAAVTTRHLTGHLLSCAIYRALSSVIPDEIIADSGGSPAMRARFLGEGGAGRFSVNLFASAGMGASAIRDGMSTTAFPTNSGAGSIEALEAVSPLLFKRKEFRVDSGGAGHFRGGLGQEIEIENVTEDPITMILAGDRERHPALGLLGGQPGAVAAATMSDGSNLRLKSRTTIAPGDSVTIHFAGGGGYGPPADRPIEAIERDLMAGVITAAAARHDYGARVEPLLQKSQSHA